MIETKDNLSLNAENPNRFSYGRYCELGGTIDEESYTEAVAKVAQTKQLPNCFIGQAERIAQTIGMKLKNTTEGLDPVITVYGVLREVINPEARFHLGQVCDQRIFAESLRITDHAEMIGRMYILYPNIFND